MNINKKDEWQARFGWIWYDEEEILRFTQEDMDKRVETFYDEGLSILIGHSCSHFRFVFYQHWDKINDCIEMLVKACHKYGIRYVEHHSSSLTYNPLTEEEDKMVDRTLKSRHTTREAWEGFDESIKGDPVLHGKKISSFRQVSGATGQWARTRFYLGSCMCYNNPDYREEYFRYLADVYARGVDGIMTDDVQFFGNDENGRWNACTCEHCRRLFREKTGYEIPQPEEWDSFYNNYSNPVFVAWKRFKSESTRDFVYAVNEHYRSLGYEMLRPNYISDILRHNNTAYPFENCAEVWDYIFQENCNSFIIKESYLRFAMEAIHRFAMARKRGVPSMSMFYPCTQSSLAFSWALAKAWGQLYTQTPGEEKTGKLSEQLYRSFEKKYDYIFENPRKLSDIAFLLSSNTRDYTAASLEYMQGFLRWMQASYLSGIGTDLLFEEESEEEFKRYPCIVAAHTAMLSVGCLETLAAYVRQGGKLVITGSFSLFDIDGQDGSARLIRIFGKLPDEGESKAFGRGMIYRLSDSVCPDVLQDYVRAPRFIEETNQVQVPSYAVETLRHTAGAALRAVLGSCKLEAKCETDLFASAFRNKKGIALHLVNVENTVSRDGMTSQTVPVPAFMEGADPVGPVQVHLLSDVKPDRVIFYTPECGKENDIAFEYDGGIRFELPGGLFSGYGVVQIYE